MIKWHVYLQYSMRFSILTFRSAWSESSSIWIRTRDCVSRASPRAVKAVYPVPWKAYSKLLGGGVQQIQLRYAFIVVENNMCNSISFFTSTAPGRSATTKCNVIVKCPLSFWSCREVGYSTCDGCIISFFYIICFDGVGCLIIGRKGFSLQNGVGSFHILYNIIYYKVLSSERRGFSNPWCYPYSLEDVIFYNMSFDEINDILQIIWHDTIHSITI